MTYDEVKVIVNKLVDEIEPAIVAARQELLEHDWRLEIRTEPSGIISWSAFKLTPVRVTKTKAKQSREA